MDLLLRVFCFLGWHVMHDDDLTGTLAEGWGIYSATCVHCGHHESSSNRGV